MTIVYFRWVYICTVCQDHDLIHEGLVHCRNDHRSTEPEIRVRKPWCLDVPILSHLARTPLFRILLTLCEERTREPLLWGANIVFRDPAVILALGESWQCWALALGSQRKATKASIGVAGRTFTMF